MTKKLTRWAVSLAISVFMFAAVLFAINPFTTKNASASNFPLEVNGTWYLSDLGGRSTMLSSIRDDMFDGSINPYATLDGGYSVPSGSLDPSAVVEFYTDSTYSTTLESTFIGDKTLANTDLSEFLTSGHLYFTVTLPANNGFDEMDAEQFDIKIEQDHTISLFPQIKIYGNNANGDSEQYTGQALEFEISFVDSSSNPIDLSDKDITASISGWKTAAGADVNEAIYAPGSYKDPVISISGSDAGDYSVNQFEADTFTFTILPRNIVLNATITYTGGVAYASISAVHTASEEAWLENHSLSIALPVCSFDQIDAGKDYTSVGSDYNLLVTKQDDDGCYNFVAGENGYDITTNTAKYCYSIIKKALTITNELPNLSEQYGDAPELPALTYSGFVDGENASNVDTIITWYYSIDNDDWFEYQEIDLFDGEDAPEVGSYYIKVEATFANYEAEARYFTFTVVPRVLSVTYSAYEPGNGTFDLGTKTYTFTYDGTAHNAKQPVIGNTYNGRTLDQEGIEVVFALAAQTNWIEGGYTYTVAISGNNNYVLQDNSSAKVVINKRSITITADNKNSSYGDSLVELTATIGGTDGSIVGSDEVFTIETNANNTIIGEYQITITNLNNANYEITDITDGAYTIAKRNITVQINNQTTAYGNEIVGFTASVVSGSVVGGGTPYELKCYENPEDVNKVEISTTTGVGGYRIEGQCTNSNYNITFQNEGNTSIYATYTITAREITIAINPAESVYGSAKAALSANEEQIINGDSNVYSLSCDVTASTAVGTYSITGECLSENYSITFTGGENAYSVTKAPLTITATSWDIQYGSAAPDYSVQYGSFVNGETEAVLGGTLAFECSYEQYNNVGEYTIIPSGLTSNNYDITFVNNILVVSPRPVTITISASSSVYGSATATFADNHNEVLLTEADKANWASFYSLTAAISSTSAVGEYNVVGTDLNSSDRYIVTFTLDSGTNAHTITPREITLSWANTTFEYNEQTHKPTATAGNLVNGDEITIVVSGEQAESGTHTATATQIVGAKAANYKLPASATCEFTITKPSSYNKPIDEEAAATDGINITEIFNNVNFDNGDAELKLEIGKTTVVFNKDAINALSESSDVKLTISTKSGKDAAAAHKGAEMVFEISLSGATFENGVATITADFENKAPTGKVAKVYYVDANGKMTDMHAVFADGKLAFNTNHFSTYIVKYELSSGTIAGIVVACVVCAILVAFAVVWFCVLKHGFKDLKNICKKDSWKFKNRNKKAEAKPQAEAAQNAENETDAKVKAKAPAKAPAKKQPAKVKTKPTRVLKRKK